MKFSNLLFSTAVLSCAALLGAASEVRYLLIGGIFVIYHTATRG